MKPLVTIVVVSYNHSKYIKECLDSIQSQTYQNIELVVADDASSDNSVEIFDYWIAENNYTSKKNYHTQNTGLANVLNECIEMATGKYIKLLAADDYLHPDAITECVTKLEIAGDDYGMVYSDTYTINDESVVISDIANYDALSNIDPIVFRDNLLIGNCIAALTVLMRLDVLKETGKYDSQFIVEDYYRWLKISDKYFITYIPKKLSYYRQHSNNISKIKAERIDQEDLILKLKFDKNGIAKTIINRKLLTKYLSKTTLDKELVALYINYPYSTKRLAMALNYNIPPTVYKMISKIL